MEGEDFKTVTGMGKASPRVPWLLEVGAGNVCANYKA